MSVVLVLLLSRSGVVLVFGVACVGIACGAVHVAAVTDECDVFAVSLQVFSLTLTVVW